MTEATETVRRQGQEIGAAVMRVLIVLHRYLGVTAGLIMLLWCLSGFVMLYANFPNTSNEERVRGLAPLSLAECCDASRIDVPDDAELGSLSVEMLAGEPVLRLGRSGRDALYNLRTGAPIEFLEEAQVRAVARDYAKGAGLVGVPSPPLPIVKDQWTVSGAERNAPIYKVAANDRTGAEIYVSASSGRVIQDTDRLERILGWLGPVPHWLYPTLLKQNNALWSQIVIWSAVAGVFLTVMGLALGVVRLRRRPNGRWSPYRGVHWQHHVVGLAFGLFTLTWVFSGLLTMGPWGLLRSEGAQTRRAFAGSITWGEAKRILALAPALAAPGVVQIEAAPLGGRLRVLANTADGGARRFDLDGRPAPLGRGELLAAAAAMGEPVKSLELLTREDAYHYSHGRTVVLPVQRLVLADRAESRLYIHPVSGKVIRVFDPPARQRRWFESALHDLDLPLLRSRPLWDIVIIPLLLGVTFICATGVWMGLRRVTSDVRQATALRPRLRRKSARA